jgi:hypothetical protein
MGIRGSLKTEGFSSAARRLFSFFEMVNVRSLTFDLGKPFVLEVNVEFTVLKLVADVIVLLFELIDDVVETVLVEPKRLRVAIFFLRISIIFSMRSRSIFKLSLLGFYNKKIYEKAF